MLDTANYVARMLVALMEEHGVRYAIVSPGSRNAPLLMAISRRSGIHTEVVIDERSAAFVALGIAVASSQPVALICTSGTAMLNYAPAVAEAFYRKIPLIVVTADRPMEWIDQDDSQTIHQVGALSNYVKRSYDIPPVDIPSYRWYANRIVNDALLSAVSGVPAPVHINMQISEPLNAICQCPEESYRKISLISPHLDMSVAEFKVIGNRLLSPCKVMIVAGFMNPDKILNQALKRLASLSNFVVLTETIANLHGQDFISSIDSTLAVLPEASDNYVPDIVITLGGALVSRHIKKFLRSHESIVHWHVGLTDTTVDCFRSVTERINMSPALFFKGLASVMPLQSSVSGFASLWRTLRDKADSLRRSFVARVPWCDMKVFATLIPEIPRRWNVHYSNGTAIRYAQLFGDHNYHRCDCNRGVSGIDGCTSTAIGASVVYNDVTLLVSGDMSAQYDIGALACRAVSPRFKMIVIRNGGGGIFRFVESTKHLDILDDYFCVSSVLPLEELARGYGFSYFHAGSEEELRMRFRDFAAESLRPAIMAVDTPAQLSAEILDRYFNQIKQAI